MTALAWVLVAVLAVVAAVAAGAWWRVRGGMERTRAHLDAERRRLTETLHSRDETLRAREASLRQARDLLQRLKRSWAAERAFNRDLRVQLHRLQEQRRRGEAEGDGDPRALVLRAALSLLDAEKGLLLARADADHDGRLDLAVAQGFEQDPEDSVIVQRFARRVLARDEAVREDAPQAEQGQELTDADREIESLVALPLYIQDRFDGVVILANRPGGFEECDDELLLSLGDHAGAALQGHQLRRDLGDTRRAAVRALAEASLAREVAGRPEASAAVIHAAWFVEALGLDDDERESLVWAAALRQLGSLGIPERILASRAALTPEERSVVELRPRIAFDLLREIPGLQDVAYALLYQHERYDGHGYPAGLAGDRIPRVARALAVVDAYTAMTHERPYRPALAPRAARRALLDHAGAQFDPELALVFARRAESEEPRLDRPVADAVAEALLPGGARRSGSVPEPLAGHVDALTLIGSHRAFHEAAEAAAQRTEGPGFAVALIELESLPRINREEGYAAGDRVIQAAARSAQRAAARLGGAAFRDSGRHLAVLVPAETDADGERLARELYAEFSLGPSVRIATECALQGEDGEEVVARARARLVAEARL